MPLTDAQVTKLQKQFRLTSRWDGGIHGWTVRGWYEGKTGALHEEATSFDLNAAVEQCVAMMRAAGGTA